MSSTEKRKAIFPVGFAGFFSTVSRTSRGPCAAAWVPELFVPPVPEPHRNQPPVPRAATRTSASRARGHLGRRLGAGGCAGGAGGVGGVYIDGGGPKLTRGSLSYGGLVVAERFCNGGGDGWRCGSE